MIIMHQPIFDFIKSKVAITDEALTEALTYVRFVHYPKGDHLLRIGQYCRYVAFLNKGLIMQAHEFRIVCGSFIHPNSQSNRAASRPRS